MRLVRYNVAASLDGFIADANGAFDWIPDDPAVDFAALFANVDTVLLGRRSWELVEGGTETPGGTGKPGNCPILGGSRARSQAAWRSQRTTPYWRPSAAS